jgi:hypothetical protein
VEFYVLEKSFPFDTEVSFYFHKKIRNSSNSVSGDVMKLQLMEDIRKIEELIF